MPAEWTVRAISPGRPEEGRAVRLVLRPNNSMTAGGFVAFIAITAGLLLLPLLAVLGSPVLWFLLPFLLGVLALAWVMLRHSVSTRARLSETVEIEPERMTLRRREPSGRELDWDANPYWVRVRLHEEGGPVPNYLTLEGGPRRVELGSFLSADEREDLAADLDRALDRVRSPRH